METGYTESEDGLRKDADIILKGSKGKVGLVIVVKITPVAPGQTMPQGGYVEVWGYDRLKDGGVSKKVVNKKVTPIPLTVSLRVIFTNSFLGPFPSPGKPRQSAHTIQLV